MRSLQLGSLRIRLARRTGFVRFDFAYERKRVAPVLPAPTVDGTLQGFRTTKILTKTLCDLYAFLMLKSLVSVSVCLSRIAMQSAMAKEAEMSMSSRTSIMLVVVVIAALVATGAMLGTAVAQKASATKPQDNLALGEGEVKKLLLLMDTDNDGKVSKQEFMRFMEAEFDRLDKKKEGKLDVKEVTQPQTPPTRGFRK
jgi:EF hand